MDEVRVVRRRTHVWPVVLAVIVLALIIAWALFAMNGGATTDLGWFAPDAGLLTVAPDTNASAPV